MLNIDENFELLLSRQTCKSLQSECAYVRACMRACVHACMHAYVCSFFLSFLISFFPSISFFLSFLLSLSFFLSVCLCVPKFIFAVRVTFYSQKNHSLSIFWLSLQF